VLKTLEGIQSEFNGVQSGGKKISLADLIEVVNLDRFDLG
jgi:catalase-peroxidase